MHACGPVTLASDLTIVGLACATERPKPTCMTIHDGLRGVITGAACLLRHYARLNVYPAIELTNKKLYLCAASIMMRWQQNTRFDILQRVNNHRTVCAASFMMHWQQNTRDDILQGVRGRKEVQLFLDDPNTAVLCVRALRGGGVRLSNSLGLLQGGSEGAAEGRHFFFFFFSSSFGKAAVPPVSPQTYVL